MAIPDDGSVVCLPGQDVEGPDRPFDDFLHPDTVSVRAGRLTATSPTLDVLKLWNIYCKEVALCFSNYQTTLKLSVDVNFSKDYQPFRLSLVWYLECSDEKVYQPWNGAVFAEG